MSPDWAFKKIEQIANCVIEMRSKLLPAMSQELGMEALCYLQNPGGIGITPIGREGEEHIRDLAIEALKRGGLNNRASIRSADEFLKPLIAKALLVDSAKVDEAYCNGMLKETGKALAKRCHQRTHFFPVHLMGDKVPGTLDLGLVRFHNKIALQSVFAAGIKRNENGRHFEEEHWEKSLSRALEHYAQFNWVAEVVITDCDADRSLELATKAVRRAVDFLHLIIGRKWTRRFNPSASLAADKMKYHISLSGDGQVEYNYSTAGLVEVSLGKEWPDFLEDQDEAFYLVKARQLIQIAVDPNPKGPLGLRYLDALQWYGEAVRDKFPASAVVKYALCLERLLITDDEGDITKTLADRVSTLGMPENQRSIQLRKQLNRNMRKAYDLRSKLVHGAISPEDSKVSAGIGNCGDLAERILKMYLIALPIERFSEAKWNSKHLGVSVIKDIGPSRLAE